MSAALVQSAVGTNTSSGAFSFGVGSTITVGNTVIVGTLSFGSNAATIHVSDNQSNTYTKDLDVTTQFGRITVWRCSNIGTSGVNTITVDNSGNFFSATSAIALEYSGLSNTSQPNAQVSAANDQTNVTSWSSNSITTSGSCVLIGLLGDGNTANGSYATSGAWGGGVRVNQATDGDDGFFEQQLNVASGTYSAAGTASTPNGPSSIAIAYLVAGGGGGGGSTSKNSLMLVGTGF